MHTLGGGGKIKTPISYYGGKQQLAGKIIKILEQSPVQKLYCEPFFGGGAVFFAKKPAEVEVINDVNNCLITFYQVLKTDFNSLQKEVETGLHSRNLHRQARVVIDNPDMFSEVKIAWAVWVLSNQSFGCGWDAGWGYDRSGATSKKIANKRLVFTEALSERLRTAEIESYDALKIIKSRDTTDTLFYLDPPYPGTDQGHYDGYSEEDFRALLNILQNIKGKFLLSSFRNKYLYEYTSNNGWHTAEFKMAKNMTASAEKHTNKIEVVTANFPFEIS